MTNIMLVDDHKVIHKGLKAIFDGESNYKLKYSAYNGTEAIENVKKYQKRIDVILMDIRMPKMDGIETTKIIHTNNPEIPIIAISMFEDEEIVSTMAKAGAVNFIPKNSSKSEILHAIFEVTTGNKK